MGLVYLKKLYVLVTIDTPELFNHEVELFATEFQLKKNWNQHQFMVQQWNNFGAEISATVTI